MYLIVRNAILNNSGGLESDIMNNFMLKIESLDKVLNKYRLPKLVRNIQS